MFEVSFSKCRGSWQYESYVCEVVFSVLSGVSYDEAAMFSKHRDEKGETTVPCVDLITKALPPPLISSLPLLGC